MAVLFADGQIDAVQFATASKRLDEKAGAVAAAFAKAEWRSPLESLAQGNIREAWERSAVAPFAPAHQDTD